MTKLSELSQEKAEALTDHIDRLRDAAEALASSLEDAIERAEDGEYGSPASWADLSCALDSNGVIDIVGAAADIEEATS